MSNLPASGLLGGTPTNAQFATYIEDFRDWAVEGILGASVRYGLTIAGGSVTPPDGATGGGGVFTIETEASAAADDLTNIVQTNTHDGQWLMISCVNATHVVTVKHAAGGTGQIILTDSADLVLDALDKWVLLRRNSTTWVEIMRGYGTDYFKQQDFDRVAQLVSHNTLCPHSRLRIDYATAATLTAAADAVVLYDSANHAKRFNSLSETLNVANTGANGRDVVDNAGAEQANVWYHLFAIGKTDGTLDVFASQVGFPGSGTSIYTRLPSGYTFAGYLGAIYNDGSSNLIATVQRGTRAVRSDLSLLSLGTSTSYTSVGITAAVPQTAQEIDIAVQVNPTASGNGAGVNLAYVAPTAADTYAAWWGHSDFDGGYGAMAPGAVMLTAAQTLFYKSGSSLSQVSITAKGWRY